MDVYDDAGEYLTYAVRGAAMQEGDPCPAKCVVYPDGTLATIEARVAYEDDEGLESVDILLCPHCYWAGLVE